MLRSGRPADLPLQEAIGQNGQRLPYARASCDWKSSMPKHSLDARRSGRPASRIKAVWGALNGTFVATIIGVAGAMGAALIPVYLDSSHGHSAASGRGSTRGDISHFRDFPRPLAAPPPREALPPGEAQPAGSTIYREHVPCRRGFTHSPGTYLQHLDASQSSTGGQRPSGPAGYGCRHLSRRPHGTDGPRPDSQAPST